MEKKKMSDENLKLTLWMISNKISFILDDLVDLEGMMGRLLDELYGDEKERE